MPYVPPADLVPPSSQGRAFWWLLLLAVPMLVFIVPLWKVARRLHRPRARSTRYAVLGAWWEATDRLREAGIAVPRGATTGEVCASCPEPVSPSVRALAMVVGRAAYAPEDPPDSQRREAWQATARIRRDLRRALSRPARLRAWLDHRPRLRR